MNKEIFDFNPNFTLYEYLGKPAGRDLGREVCRKAVDLGEPIEERFIENSKYKGNVHAYRYEFLLKYFENKI
jgi:hypothetical protein